MINNRIWNADYYSILPVGQLPEGEANYVQDARWALPAGFHSDHICHPEWLPTGEPFPTDLPPQEYTAGNMPICCGWIDDGPRGGLTLGGSAGDIFSPRDATSGGMIVGGSAGDVHIPPHAAQGGIVIGGSAGDAHFPPDPTEGGIEIGGEAGDLFSPVDPTEGGIEIGGEAGDEYIPACHGEQLYDVAIETTFTAPCTKHYLVECWGCGGNGLGQVADAAPFCSGGGGGAYARRLVLLFEGVSYPVYVAAGGSEVNTSFALMDATRETIAAFGNNATGDVGALGGLDTDCVGDTTYSGGDGGSFGGVPSGGGGGGGGAGSGGPGNDGGNGTDPTGGTVGGGTASGGGDGGAGGDTGFDGGIGLAAGGGGGGGGTGTTVGGIGARGQMLITW